MNEQSGHLPVGLRTIALLEAVKGLLALAAVCGVLSLRHTDLHAATDAFLLRHGIDPERHYTRVFIETVAGATNRHSGQIIGVGLAYGLIRLAEGYGLWRGKHWAEWFAVLSAGSYLPLEMFHFAHRPRLFTAGIIVFNLVVILYLGKLLVQQRAERKRRLKASKEKAIGVFLALVFAGATASSAADVGRAPGGQKQDGAVLESAVKPKPVNSATDSVETPPPQLSASSGALPEALLERETNEPALSPPPTPGADRRQKTGGMILLVLAVVAGSYLRQRWRSQPGPSGHDR